MNFSLRCSFFGLSLLLLFLALMSQSCRKNQFREGLPLDFSVDTLLFDTVFTDMGSATRRFTVYNPHKNPMLLSEVRLSGGSQSDFKINVDGLTGPVARDIEILPEDSIHVFVTVRINPAVGDAIRMDSLFFESGDSRQTIYLSAYGWNAIYIGQVGFLTRFVNADIEFTNQQPYILMGLVAIDSFSTLRIAPGTQVFMFGGPSTRPGDRATLFIGDHSTLLCGIGGSIQNAVEFRTHRLEDDYQEVPFQHGGIYLSRLSRDNRIEHTVIRNAVDGIIIDSLSVTSNPKLSIKQSKIFNVDRSCILSRQGSLYAENVLLANSNSYAFIAIRGGAHRFVQSTLANYATSAFLSRKEPVLSLRDFEIVRDGDTEIRLLADASNVFENCIIYGTRNEELEAIQSEGSTAQWNLDFSRCLLRLDTFSRGLNNECIVNQDPLFRDVDAYDYRPDSLSSPLIDAGLPLGIQQDLRGYGRDNSPDIGAYEGVF